MSRDLPSLMTNPRWGGNHPNWASVAALFFRLLSGRPDTISTWEPASQRPRQTTCIACCAGTWISPINKVATLGENPGLAAHRVVDFGWRPRSDSPSSCRLWVFSPPLRLIESSTLGGDPGLNSSSSRRLWVFSPPLRLIESSTLGLLPFSATHRVVHFGSSPGAPKAARS